MSWFKAALFGALLFLGGCGYHSMAQPALLPGGVQSLHIALFGNRTTEAFLENALTDAVIERFSRQRSLQLLESTDQAEGLLSGELVSYSITASAYNPADQITEYRLTLVVAAEMRRRADGRVLWKGTVQWMEEFPAAGDKTFQEDNEAVAAQLAIERLAEELHYRTLANF